MADVKNVSTGKPKTAGAISVGPTTATLPTSALTDLTSGFKSLGYVSSDGLTNSNTPESESITAWGGDTVQTLQTSKEDTFSFTLIEVLNVDVLETVYGKENVTVDSTTGEITVKANAKPASAYAYVIDILLSENMLKRIVIPNAKITEIGEIVYKDEEAIGYEITLTLLPDKDENTHYEYIVKAETE